VAFAIVKEQSRSQDSYFVKTNSCPHVDCLKFGNPDKKKLILSIYLSQASAASIFKKSDDAAQIGSDWFLPGSNGGNGGDDNLDDLTVRFKRAVGGKERKNQEGGIKTLNK
jgi:hypothetical protein